MATVSFDGTRITGAETADSASWNDRGGGGGSIQSSDLVIQGSESRGRRVDSTTLGFGFDNTTGIDLDGLGDHLGIWFTVGPIAAADIRANGGIRLRLGGAADPDTSPWSEWYIHGSDTWTVVGGWLRVWFDIDQGNPDQSLGTLNLASIQNFGGNFTIGNIGGNAPSAFVDAIDYVLGGGGLTLTGSGGSIDDFISYDEGTVGNRYGVVQTQGGIVYINARLTIGDGSATGYAEQSEVLIFADQEWVEIDFLGITALLGNSSDDVDFNNVVIKSAGTTNLGDIIASGTLGAFDITNCTLDSVRLIDLSPVGTITNTSIANSSGIVQNGSTLTGMTVSSPTVVSGIAFVVSDDPALISNSSFSSGGQGHAIEITATGTYTFDGNSFSSYGASGTLDAAVYNNSAGLVTLNVANATIPTHRNGNGASTALNNVVFITVNVEDITGSGLQNAAVRIGDSTDTELMNELTDVDGQAQETYNYSSDENVTIRVRKSSPGSTRYLPVVTTGLIEDTGLSVTVVMFEDDIAE